MSISYNWSRYKSHWTRLSSICDIDWLGTATKKSKAGNSVVPTNLPTTSSDSDKSYNILYNTIVIVITTSFLPIICRIVCA